MTISMDASRLAYWDDKTKQMVVEPDQVELRIGASATDIKVKQTIKVTK